MNFFWAAVDKVNFRRSSEEKFNRKITPSQRNFCGIFSNNGMLHQTARSNRNASTDNVSAKLNCFGFRNLKSVVCEITCNPSAKSKQVLKKPIMENKIDETEQSIVGKRTTHDISSYRRKRLLTNRATAVPLPSGEISKGGFSAASSASSGQHENNSAESTSQARTRENQRDSLSRPPQSEHHPNTGRHSGNDQSLGLGLTAQQVVLTAHASRHVPVDYGARRRRSSPDSGRLHPSETSDQMSMRNGSYNLDGERQVEETITRNFEPEIDVTVSGKLGLSGRNLEDQAPTDDHLGQAFFSQPKQIEDGPVTIEVLSSENIVRENEFIENHALNDPGEPKDAETDIQIKLESMTTTTQSLDESKETLNADPVGESLVIQTPASQLLGHDISAASETSKPLEGLTSGSSYTGPENYLTSEQLPTSGYTTTEATSFDITTDDETERRKKKRSRRKRTVSLNY